MPMSIDYNYLRTLSPEEGMAYLRQVLASGAGQYSAADNTYSGLGSDAKITEYYADNPNGITGEGGRFEGSGVLSGRNAIIEGGDPERSYVAQFDTDGNLVDVGQQMADSWYDKEVLGVPIGAFLPIAAAAAAAYAPGLLGEGAINSAAGEAVLTGGTGTDVLANSLYTLAPEGTSVTLGGSTTTLGGSGIGGSALGSGLTPGVSIGSGIGGGAIGSGLTVGGLTAGEIAGTAASSLPSWLRPVADAVGGAKNLAGLAGAVIGAATSRDGEKTVTTSREPWGPAQDWLKDNIRYGQELQKKYREEPFSDLQKTAYKNFYSGLDSFNNTTAPGLLNWAGSYMNGSRNFDPAAALSGFGGGGLLGGGASPFGVPQMTSYSDALRRMWG